ncbi:efflux RND transporter periplasmic adaptor subunit [Novosphingobium mangrovi (ex Huang et al. 2023)]|uniref:Efflux RND transporter periplasmic adaptor subunit n=1 Tax=Novosphingobium mangrovi (ex Huang et al. 2023) TaxID=2976432 RepID=A0ABT2I9P6_9SPHN|nr:efflux RND transporter periplasmic adaptor subunit [Novosphingobium mangrovi (ex Huang et al. 2023)]MCT2401511.1 efflux RND transporter periplasmic adaptor subunit [Novosphingobium mangrovi (ex Huang et al. 2023)]
MSEGSAENRPDLDALLDTLPRAAWRRWALLVVLALGALALVLLGMRFISGGQAANYRSEPVERASLDLAVAGSGRLEPWKVRGVGATLAGDVEAVLVKPGDRVLQGQVLARLSSAALVEARDRNRELVESRSAALAEAESAVERMRGRLSLFARVRRESDGLAPSSREMTAANIALRRAGEDLETAQVELQAARRQADRIAAQVAATEIRAPFEGVVMQSRAAPGMRVGPSSTGRPLFEIAAPYARLRMYVPVEQAQGPLPKRGAAVDLQVEGRSGRTFDARLESVVSDPDRPSASRSRRYDLVIEVPNADLSLRPGITARARVAIGERREGLVVPEEALRFARAADAGHDAAGGSAVYVLDSDGTPRRVPVDLQGGDGRGRVMVSGALTPGTHVILGLR